MPVYCDQMYSGSFNYKKHAFIVKNKNVKFSNNQIFTEKISVIGGFSEINGKVKIHLTEETVDQDTMIVWMKEVKLHRSQYFLVLENWSIHTGGRFLKFCRDNGIQLVMMPTYTPILNGAEGCWSLIKRQHEKLRL